MMAVAAVDQPLSSANCMRVSSFFAGHVLKVSWSHIIDLARCWLSLVAL